MTDPVAAWDHYKDLVAERDRLQEKNRILQRDVTHALSSLCTECEGIKAQYAAQVASLRTSREESLRRARALKAERDRLREILGRIATNYDCDPRAEARNALEGNQ